jgi:hypothetical protein
MLDGQQRKLCERTTTTYIRLKLID